MLVRARRRIIAHLKHGQEQMLFATLVLVSVKGEHDCLQKCVNLCQTDKTTESCNVPGLGLQEEEEVAVLLCFAIVEDGARWLLGVFECTGYFGLLESEESGVCRFRGMRRVL